MPGSIQSFVFWIFPSLDTAVQLEPADSKYKTISKSLFHDCFRHIFWTMRKMHHTFWKKRPLAFLTLWLVWVKIESTYVSLPKWTINWFQPVKQSRQQVLRAYCPNLILCLSHLSVSQFLWRAQFCSEKQNWKLVIFSYLAWVDVNFSKYVGAFWFLWPAFMKYFYF